MARNAESRPGWDLTHLRTFVAVAQEGHLTRGAERLRISQPAASLHVRALEKSLGVDLFVRTNHGLEMTVAGRRLASLAERVLGEAAGLDSLAREMRGSIAGRLYLGSNADPAVSKLGRVVSLLRERHPLLDLNVHMRSSLAATQGVHAAELDAAFVLGSALAEGLSGRRLADLHYRITGPAAWAKKLDAAGWQALAGLPWITTAPGTSNHEMREALFARHGLVVNSAVETNNDLLLRALIADGVGIGLVREDFAEAGVRDGVYAVAPVGRATTHLQFVHATARAADPVIRAAQDVVSELWPDAR